ncbi:hypothetical protein AB1Y20_007458 [Prymnesium parvum]|uniref:Centrosomal protein of 44 kDa n=1 Tax=Prymnesium parvum TaxID=97485 RepID=A0AB34IV99_PRYPA
MALVSGDISNRLEQLRSELRRWRFAGEFPLPQLSTGDPSAFLPLLHFVLLHASAPLSKWLSDRGYELAGKCDLRFVEVVYRLCRAEFNYNPVLTSKQFLTAAFAERKLQMVADLSARCRAKHKDLVRALTMGRKVGPSMAAYQAGGADMLSTPKRTKNVALATVASPSMPTTEQPRSTVPRPTSSSGERASGRPIPVLPRVARSAQGSLPRATVVCELPSNSQPSGTNVPLPPDHACAKSLTATCRMATYDSLPGDQRGHMCSIDNFAATPDAVDLEPQQLDLQGFVDARTSEEEVNSSYNRAVIYEPPQLDSPDHTRNINSFFTEPTTAGGREPPELDQGVLEDARTFEREVKLSYGEHASFFMTAVQGVSAEELEEEAEDSADDDEEILAHHALVDTAFGHSAAALPSLLDSALPPMADPHLRPVVEPALADATDFHGDWLNGKFTLGRAMSPERDQVLSSAPVALLSCLPSPVRLLVIGPALLARA